MSDSSDYEYSSLPPITSNRVGERERYSSCVSSVAGGRDLTSTGPVSYSHDSRIHTVCD